MLRELTITHPLKTNFRSSQSAQIKCLSPCTQSNASTGIYNFFALRNTKILGLRSAINNHCFKQNYELVCSGQFMLFLLSIGFCKMRPRTADGVFRKLKDRPITVLCLVGTRTKLKASETQHQTVAQNKSGGSRKIFHCFRNADLTHKDIWFGLNCEISF